METEDKILINDILEGDKQKYALLMRKYNQRLYRICKGYLREEAEIEDVMQETYIKAYQNLRKFENHSAFSTWLIRILINECLQRLKSLNRLSLFDDDDKIAEAMNLTDKKNPETVSIERELKTVLETTIADLPEKYRSVFIMREIEKMSVAETCELLDLSESNVKTRLNRAKEMLRTALMETYPMGMLYEFNLIRCDRIAANVLSRI